MDADAADGNPALRQKVRVRKTSELLESETCSATRRETIRVQESRSWVLETLDSRRHPRILCVFHADRVGLSLAVREAEATFLLMLASLLPVLLAQAVITTRPLCNFMDRASFLEAAQTRLKLRRRGLQLPESKCSQSAEDVVLGNMEMLTGRAGWQALREYHELLLMPDGDEVWQQDLGVRKSACIALILIGVGDTFRRLILPFEGLPYKALTLVEGDPRDALRSAEALRNQHTRCPACSDPLFSEVSWDN